MASIAGLTFNSITQVDQTYAKITNVVQVPYGRSIPYVRGVEPVSVSLLIDAHADTDANALVLQKQLKEMAGNPGMYLVYIDFDRDNNLDGWYQIGSAQTSLQGNLFGHYPMTIPALRVGGKDALVGVYWERAELTHEFPGITSLIDGVPLLNTAAYAGGSIRVINISATEKVYMKDNPSDNPVLCSLETLANLHIGDVKIYDGTLTDTSSWKRVYGPDHVFTNDMIVSNDIAVLAWRSSVKYAQIGLNLKTVNTSMSSTSYIGMILGPAVSGTSMVAHNAPRIKVLSPFRCVVQFVFADATSKGISTIDFEIKKGEPFITGKLQTKTQTISDISTLAHGPITSLYNATNSQSGYATGVAYDSTSNFGVAESSYTDGVTIAMQCGFIYTTQGVGDVYPAGSGSDTEFLYGRSVAANTTEYFGVFITGDKSTSELTQMGKRFLANVRTQLVLVD